MAIAGGFRIHDETVLKRYRVPDLLTEEEFKTYMAGIYGVGIEFRDLTKEEKERIDSGERLVATPSEPLVSDQEIVKLRELLGITSLEEKLNIKRSTDAKNLDPVVEHDSRTMSDDDFQKKYGSPKPSSGSTSTTKEAS